MENVTGLRTTATERAWDDQLGEKTQNLESEHVNKVKHASVILSSAHLPKFLQYCAPVSSMTKKKLGYLLWNSARSVFRVCTRILLTDGETKCAAMFNKTVRGVDLGDSSRTALVKEGRQSKFATLGKKERF